MYGINPITQSNYVIEIYRLTIVEGHYSGREITLYTTANHIAGDHCKGVVREWQQLS